MDCPFRLESATVGTFTGLRQALLCLFYLPSLAGYQVPEMVVVLKGDITGGQWRAAGKAGKAGSLCVFL